MDKIALFDFCETIVSFQSADRYVEFVMKKESITGGLKETIRRILNKTKMMRILQLFSKEGYINKRMVLRCISGMDRATLEKDARQYYEEDIKPHLILPVVNRLVELKNEGFEICVVSAGYDIYLRFFCEEYGVDKLICTRLLFDNDLFTGLYEGKDLQSEEKVLALRKSYGVRDFRSINSIAFTDSITDMPMIDLCQRGVIVTRKKSGWMDDNRLEVLIWD